MGPTDANPYRKLCIHQRKITHMRAPSSLKSSGKGIYRFSHRTQISSHDNVVRVNCTPKVPKDARFGYLHARMRWVPRDPWPRLACGPRASRTDTALQIINCRMDEVVPVCSRATEEQQQAPVVHVEAFFLLVSFIVVFFLWLESGCLGECFGICADGGLQVLHIVFFSLFSLADYAKGAKRVILHVFLVLIVLLVPMGQQCENGGREVGFNGFSRVCVLSTAVGSKFVYIGRCGPVGSLLSFFLSPPSFTNTQHHSLPPHQPTTSPKSNHTMHLLLPTPTLILFLTLLLPTLASHDPRNEPHYPTSFPTATGTTPTTCPTKTITTTLHSTTTITVTMGTGTGGYYPTATGTGASSGTGVYFPTAGLRYVRPRRQRREEFRWV